MEAKEYLERLLFLDKEISSKIATIQPGFPEIYNEGGSTSKLTNMSFCF